MTTSKPRKKTTTRAPAGNKAPSRTAGPAAKAGAASKPGVAAGTRPRARRPASPKVTPEERYRMVAEAAYYKAEQRGFSRDGEVEDWIAAEREIDQMLAARAPKPRRSRSTG